MGEVLGLGLTHYPMLMYPDANMADLLRWTLEDPDIPASAKELASWPPEMQQEYGADGGTAAAARHREALLSGFASCRKALDEFRPDVVLIWGDDQYENFREDVIPPFSILAYDDFTERPYAHGPERQNVWGEPVDTGFPITGHREFAKELTSTLLENGVDAAYAYKPLHAEGWGHAFTNTMLYLDYHRQGFEYPMVAFHINCYGRRVISAKGSLTRFADVTEKDLDPPSPTPSRCMQIGRVVAKAISKSPYRVAVVASSSWSHAFLTDKTWRLRPDTESDRRLYEALQTGDYATWEGVSLSQLEESGQQELLNWFCLAGAMQELKRTPDESQLVETNVFNSNKCFAIFRP